MSIILNNWYKTCVHFSTIKLFTANKKTEAILEQVELFKYTQLSDVGFIIYGTDLGE